MSKGIELTQTQIKAYEDVATMFMFPIDTNKISINLNEENELYFNSAYKFECSYCKGKDSQCTDCYGKGYIWDLDCESKEEFIAKYSPIQKGDKDIFVQENFATDPIIKEHILYESNFDGESFEYFCEHIGSISKIASKMTKEQSRYSFNECIDAKAIRVQEINIKDIPKIQTEMWMFDDWYNQQLKEQNINRTYEDNDYVFLVEFA